MIKNNNCSATFNMVVEQTMQYYRHNKTQILCGDGIDKRFAQLVQRCTNWAVRANLWDYSTYKDKTTKEILMQFQRMVSLASQSCFLKGVLYGKGKIEIFYYRGWSR